MTAPALFMSPERPAYLAGAGVFLKVDLMLSQISTGTLFLLHDHDLLEDGEEVVHAQ